MPVYEYRCGKCGHEFEELQRITAAPIRKCPQCGKHAVERLISKTSFILKGSGWYKTDYASSSSPDGSASKDSKPESKPSSSTESKPASSTESKPSSSTESKPASSTESKSAPAHA